jgi:RNA ligase (TIGR02306 family)
MTTETYTRKMASIQEVNSITMIPGADRICQYGVLGWKVIDQVGKYQVGDKVIFCEIDAFIPSTVAPFLTKPEHFPKEFNGVKGEKLRTIRLRKALSQGLILPISVMGEENYKDRSSRGLENCWVKLIGENTLGATDKIGADVAQFLNIQKWEAPPEFLNADTKGNFPQFLFKSDQQRIQNYFGDVVDLFEMTTWEVQEKVEGQSFTAYLCNGEFGVCSRNLELKDSDNTFWNNARKYDLETKLRSLGKNIAIVAEQTGPKISGNIYGMTEHALFVFDIFDIDTQSYLSPVERRELTKQLGLTDAPVLNYNFILDGMSLDDILGFADGKSVLGFTNTLREGLVFKANLPGRISFKSVSNLYLLGSKE